MLAACRAVCALLKKRTTEPMKEQSNERTALTAAIAVQQAAEVTRQQAQETLSAATEYLDRAERERRELTALGEAERAEHGLALIDSFRAGRATVPDESETASRLLTAERQCEAAAAAVGQLETELGSATDHAKAARGAVLTECAAVCAHEGDEILCQFLAADAEATRLRAQLAGLASVTSAFPGVVQRFVSPEAASALYRTADRYVAHKPVEHAAEWRAHVERLTIDPQDIFQSR